jgi:hypothetical protein
MVLQIPGRHFPAFLPAFFAARFVHCNTSVHRRKSEQYTRKSVAKGLWGAPSSPNARFMFLCRFNVSQAKYAMNRMFDEFCVFRERDVIVLWAIKLA